jgi:hypothetical protein
VREKYCWLIAGGWFVLREKYCWLVADKPNEQAVNQQMKHAFKVESRHGLNQQHAFKVESKQRTQGAPISGHNLI